MSSFYVRVTDTLGDVALRIHNMESRILALEAALQAAPETRCARVSHCKPGPTSGEPKPTATTTTTVVPAAAAASPPRKKAKTLPPTTTTATKKATKTPPGKQTAVPVAPPCSFILANEAGIRAYADDYRAYTA